MRNRMLLVAIVLVLGSLGCSLSTGGTTTATATVAASSPVGAVIGAGDMLYTQPLMAGLSYPNVMLPDGTPLTHPYKLSSTDTKTDFPTSPITNPSISNQAGGFIFGVCNASASKTHTLQALTVKITAFTSYGGQLNQWNGCDGTTDSHHQLTASGCGGAIALCMCFHAPFAPGATTGAEVTTSQIDDSLSSPGDHAGKLPFAMGPGQAFFAYISMDKPSGAGQYTFAMGMQVDGKTSYSLSSPKVLLAPVAHKWTGMACQQAAMLNQITATNPESYYICPS
jgi:hypothetical protein